MNASEAKLLVKLKHPDPFMDISSFMNSLFDDFVLKHFFVGQNFTLEQKRNKAYLYYLFESLDSSQSLLDMLEDYYANH